MNALAAWSLTIIPALWAVWIALWIAAAWNVKRSQWREDRRTALWNRVPVLLGTVMMIWPRLAPSVLNRQ